MCGIFFNCIKFQHQRRKNKNNSASLSQRTLLPAQRTKWKYIASSALKSGQNGYPRLYARHQH